LILLDINLPEVDGRGIFDIIDEYAPEKSIIVTSVHPLGDQRLKIPKAVDYHQKSNSDETLLKKVKKVLGV
ncbi:MAG: response regulator receiver protein, partial [Candidatus Omnitrophota bacterium]